jgi:hypothetical protein
MRYHDKTHHAIGKILSANDVGDTGGHQGGILIPKADEILSFFPLLDNSQKNPRVLLKFLDEVGDEYFFNFIYYNNYQFGGTRREFRLTGMTRYIRQNDLQAGDEIILLKDESENRHIHFTRIASSYDSNEGTIRISYRWKTINLKER